MLFPKTQTLSLALLGVSLACSCLAAPKLAVMESAFGQRVEVENIALAKKAGYQGIQILTGDLDERGLLPFSYPSVIRSFKEASEKHGVEIVGLCAGTMNKLPCWDPETKEQAYSAGIQSIQACKALDVPILLVPFFNAAGFGDDPEDPKFRAAVEMLRELTAEAEACHVTLGVESRTKQPAIDHLLSEINSPYLKVYYDTGNMLAVGENIYDVIDHWGANTICQMHLKAFDSDESLFGEGKTDLKRLAQSIHNSGYDGWLVFEPGPGKKRKLGFDYAKKNLNNIRQMFDDFPE